MYENRDDTLPRANDVMGHFKRNVKVAALNKMRDAFKAGWSSPIKITNPLDFKIEVSFGRTLPLDVVEAVEAELKEHGWTNYTMVINSVDGVSTHNLTVLLNHEEAAKYA